MILYASGMCLPRDSTVGRIGRTTGPIQRNLMVLLELSVLSVWAWMCLHVESPLFATCMRISTVTRVPRGDKPRFCRKWISIWRSDLLCHVAIRLDAVFCLRVFFSQWQMCCGGWQLQNGGAQLAKWFTLLLASPLPHESFHWQCFHFYLLYV